MARTVRLAERVRSLLVSSASQSRAFHGLSCVVPEVSFSFSSSRIVAPIMEFLHVANASPPNLVGEMELMAVPKRKVTPSRKGKRNGPKFLRAAPVVAKCKACGRIKLPQFYCCDGQIKG